jgi:DNA-binding winged helix-turn-helix (wHTH) protein
MTRFIADHFKEPDVVTLDPVNMAVVYLGRERRLIPRQWQIFNLLWKNLGQIVTHDVLIAMLEDTCSGRGSGSSVEDALVDVATLRAHICYLRKRIDGLPLHIGTIPAVGYRLTLGKEPPVVAPPVVAPHPLMVWVLMIEHKHGGGVSLHMTRHGAEHAAAEYAREWWGDRPEGAPEQPPDNDGECHSAYFDTHMEEYCTIQECPVQWW